MEKSICIFGDSTAWGAWDMEKGGWVNRLWFHIGARDENYIELYNCSISGGTSETVLKRFESEAKIRNATTLIFQTGSNDSSYRGQPNNILVSLEKFKENIQEIITRAKSITDSIIFVDLKNCDESLTMPWYEDLYFTNKNIQTYSQAMQEVCRANQVDFIDIPHLENSDFYDGLHPNTAGHEKIFQVVRDFLEVKKII